MNLDLNLVHKGNHRDLSFRWVRILDLEWIFARPREQHDCFGNKLSVDVCWRAGPVKLAAVNGSETHGRQ